MTPESEINFKLAIISEVLGLVTSGDWLPEYGDPEAEVTFYFENIKDIITKNQQLELFQGLEA